MDVRRFLSGGKTFDDARVERVDGNRPNGFHLLHYHNGRKGDVLADQSGRRQTVG